MVYDNLKVNGVGTCDLDRTALQGQGPAFVRWLDEPLSCPFAFPSILRDMSEFSVRRTSHSRRYERIAVGRQAARLLRLKRLNAFRDVTGMLDGGKRCASSTKAKASKRDNKPRLISPSRSRLKEV